MMQDKIVKINNVSKTFPGTLANDNVNFTVSDRKNIDELIHSLKDNNIDFNIVNSDELHL